MVTLVTSADHIHCLFLRTDCAGQRRQLMQMPQHNAKHHASNVSAPKQVPLRGARTAHASAALVVVS